MTWTRERWSRIESVFHRVADTRTEERAGVLDAECADDAELRREVQRLLAADDPAADALLDTGIGPVLRGHDPLLGRRFGAFELVERIGEGGMGTVYRAERRAGDFEQEAAVKVLRLGLATPASRQRFARERQTLARLVHPHVARLYDGGTNDQGVPYIAMELVDGVPIDRFCDQRHATVRQRLQWFVTVCRAVEFAHQNLIAHLDLKPGNILVDAAGVPKLVDFGVAGLLEAVADGDAAVAVTRGRPLTPEYASPELLRGEPVGTAADVWSLGAVLYELLTGARAFRPVGNDLEFARVVCETEALRPSATFVDAAEADARAANRAATAPELVRVLRGDLDRIVQKALRKEVGARYASCRELALDIERHLDGFPVTAREPTLGYRLRKFVRRNGLGVAAVIGLLLVLLAGLAATLHQARVAGAERDAAAAARAEAEQARDRAAHEAGHARTEAASNHTVAEFLGDTFLSGRFLVEPAQRQAAVATIRRKADQVRRQHAGDPHLCANLLHALGRAAARVGAIGDAEALLQEAATQRREHFGEGSLEHALSLGALGRLWYGEGRLREAVEALREAYQLHHECPPDVHSDVALAANDLAAAERALGNVDRARELHREALALRRRSGEPAQVAESLNNLANSEPDLAAARTCLEEALQLRRSVLGDDDPLTIQSTTNLATLLMRLGAWRDARPLLLEAVERSRRLSALGSEALAVALRLLALTELELADTAAAETAIDEALAVDRQRLGDDHVRLAAPLEIRAKIVERRGRWAEAAATWRQVLQLRTEMLPATHRLLPMTRCSLGTALVRAGEIDAGRAELRAASEALTAADATATDHVDAALHLALADEAAGDLDAAERRLRETLQRCTTAADAASRTDAVQAHLRDFLQRHGR